MEKYLICFAVIPGQDGCEASFVSVETTTEKPISNKQDLDVAVKRCMDKAKIYAGDVSVVAFSRFG